MRQIISVALSIIWYVIAVSLIGLLIFAAATLACHFTSGRRVCMPPLLSRVCVLREGWRRRFRVTGTQAKRERKPNEILTRV